MNRRLWLADDFKEFLVDFVLWSLRLTMIQIDLIVSNVLYCLVLYVSDRLNPPTRTKVNSWWQLAHFQGQYDLPKSSSEEPEAGCSRRKQLKVGSILSDATWYVNRSCWWFQIISSHVSLWMPAYYMEWCPINNISSDKKYTKLHNETSSWWTGYHGLVLDHVVIAKVSGMFGDLMAKWHRHPCLLMMMRRRMIFGGLGQTWASLHPLRRII